MASIDRQIAEPIDLAGSQHVVTFSAAMAAGQVILALRTRLYQMAGARFETFGAVPPQLALADGKIVRGGAAAVVGATYQLGVLTVSNDDKEGIGVTLTFRAE